ncbi:MAG: DUF1990 family protein [Gemmatimonadota bacterium]
MDDLQTPAQGAGPLLERDYWAVLDGARVGPAELAALVARHLEEFAPPTLVRFSRRRGDGASLDVGDELDVHIRGAGSFAVRVVHRDRNSLTVATLPGHPEAGRITFGAYRHRRGDVIFHIRSRARAGSRSQLAGFIFAGDPMQTNTWSDFIDRLAHSVGDGVLGAIHAEKRRVAEEPGDRQLNAPTFVAEGD